MLQKRLTFESNAEKLFGYRGGAVVIDPGKRDKKFTEFRVAITVIDKFYVDVGPESGTDHVTLLA